MKYNPDLHSRHSIRLRGYNYASTGAYFVTICCQNRKCLFGKIANGKMILNKYGEIAKKKWYELPFHHPNVELNEFIVMPNHVHGILEIMDYANMDDIVDADFAGGADVGKDVAGNAPTISGNVMSNISPKPGTLSTIVRSYKSSVSKQIHDRNDCRDVACNVPCCNVHCNTHCNTHCNAPIWQRNYHEHIIRNEMEYARIAKYIRNNPFLWKKKNLNAILL